MSGKIIRIDDKYLTGCFHNAFEGKVEKADDGCIKRGRQGICRTKGVLYGAGSDKSAATLEFTLKAVPADGITMKMNGLDDKFEEKNTLAITLNGEEVAKGEFFNNNDTSATNNARYFVGWNDATVKLPADKLKKGNNTLTLANLSSVWESAHWKHILIDYIELSANEDLQVTLAEVPAPLYYYGLEKGAELNIWPAVNLDSVTLVDGGEVEFNFYTTFPKEWLVNTAKVEVKGGRVPVELNIESDGNLEVRSLGADGPAVETTKNKGMTTHTLKTVMRVIKYTTPHPGQGVRVFMKGKGAYTGKTIRAWLTIGGAKGMVREYPLSSVNLDGGVSDVPKFNLSIWGGGMPRGGPELEAYVEMTSKAGFNHMFTGRTPEINAMLKKHGFSVYPRYGWFGHQFKVTEENEEHAAVTPAGEKVKNDFCPQAILANAEDQAMGRFFHDARESAKQENIDGLCVDFECGAVWCWCDKCLAEFEKETGIRINGDRSLVSGDGKYAAEYKDFGRMLNRKLLTRVRSIMHEENPELKYFCLASASDMPAYWWDGRTQGRHSLRELVKFADEIAASGYFYEMPGGLKSVRPILKTIETFAVEEKRLVDAGMISPIATTVSEAPRYRGVYMKPSSLRSEILLVATAGGKSLAFFRGDCFDGSYYKAAQQAMRELAMLKPYIKSGLDRSFEVEPTVKPVGDRVTRLSIAHNLLSRLEWRPELYYQYDAVQLLRNNMARDRALILFNYADNDLAMDVSIHGIFDPEYIISDMMTGEKIGTYSRYELESGKPTFTVPANNCLILRVESVPQQ